MHDTCILKLWQVIIAHTVPWAKANLNYTGQALIISSCNLLWCLFHGCLYLFLVFCHFSCSFVLVNQICYWPPYIQLPSVFFSSASSEMVEVSACIFLGNIHLWILFLFAILLIHLCWFDPSPFCLLLFTFFWSALRSVVFIHSGDYFSWKSCSISCSLLHCCRANYSGVHS